jgi:hypothetical protein
MKLAHLPSTHWVSCYPHLVFEEMLDTFTPTTKMKYSGGIHKDRIKHIKCIHVIQPAECQVYWVRKLHVVPHYSIYPSQLKQFKDDLKSHGFDLSTQLITYDNDRSYVNPDSLVNVVNFNTLEFDEFKEYFEVLDFEHAAVCALTEDTCSRGNHQLCGGVTHQSITATHEETGVKQPRFFKSATNSKVAQSMADLTTLASCYKLPSMDKALFEYQNTSKQGRTDRRSIFAEMIHKDNCFEGISFILYKSGKSENSDDWDSWITRTHVDSANSKADGLDYLFSASRCVADYDGIAKRESPNLKRICIVGYHRKSVDDFFRRVELARPIVDHVRRYWEQLPPGRRGINMEYLRDFSFHKVIAPNLFCMKSNMHKPVFLSTIVHIIRESCKISQLSLYQMIELVYAATLCSASPYSFYCLMPRVMQTVNTEEENIFVAFCKLAMEECGGIIGGPEPRSQVNLNKPMTGKQLNDSLDKILSTITQANLNKLRKTQKTYNELIVDLCKDVFGVGELSASHMVICLVFLGILEDAAWLTFARIAKGTETANKLKDEYGVPQKDNEKILASLARVLGTGRPEAESSICESHRRYQKYDYYIPGQDLCVVGRCKKTNQKGGKVPVALRIAMDGEVQLVDPFFPCPTARNNFIWLDDNELVHFKPVGRVINRDYDTLLFETPEESIRYYKDVKDMSFEEADKYMRDYKVKRTAAKKLSRKKKEQVLAR